MELCSSIGVSTREILATCHDPVELPTGEQRIISRKYSGEVTSKPWYMSATPKGVELLKKSNLPELLDDITFLNSELISESHKHRVAKQNVILPDRTITVAQKRIEAGPATIPGTHQLTATKLLQERGILLAEPLVATRWTYISEWCELQFLPEGDQDITDAQTHLSWQVYISHLKYTADGLRESGLWPYYWRLDDHTNNFAVYDVCHPEVGQRFMCVDPAWDCVGISWKEENILPCQKIVQ